MANVRRSWFSFKRGYIFIPMILIFLVISGCEAIKYVPAPRLLAQDTIIIDEDYYHPVGPFQGIDNLRIDVNVIKASYKGVELWIMTASQFSDFRYYDHVSVVDHFTLYEGERTVTISNLDPNEEYYVVFDNTNSGWVKPPFNLENDYVTLEYSVYTLKPLGE